MPKSQIRQLLKHAQRHEVTKAAWRLAQTKRKLRKATQMPHGTQITTSYQSEFGAFGHLSREGLNHWRRVFIFNSITAVIAITVPANVTSVGVFKPAAAIT